MFWFGLLLCAGCGVGVGAFVAGLSHLGGGGASGVVLTVVGANVAPWVGVAGFALLAGARGRVRRGLEAATFGPPAVLRPVLAKVESAAAVGEAGPDVPVRLDLTVAPDDRPAYRAVVLARVNLVDLAGYQPGRLLVAAHDPDQPWRVELNRTPDPAWARRAESAAVDSAPAETQAVKPDVFATPERRTLRMQVLRPGMFALYAGVAASVWLFWGTWTG
jgi:hypothetical protein